MPLQPLNSLKTQLGVISSDDDELLEQLQDAAQDFITTYCQQDFTNTSFTEFHRSGTRYLFLKNFPISSITSVQVDPLRGFGSDTTLEESQYVLLPDAGMLEAVNGSFLKIAFPNAVKVVYATSGSVPKEVQRAEVELVSHWYRQVKTHAATEHQNRLQVTDGTEVSEYPWGQSGGFRIPAGVLQLLARHRVPALG